jgi:hypothetical protein
MQLRARVQLSTYAALGLMPSTNRNEGGGGRGRRGGDKNVLVAIVFSFFPLKESSCVT